MNKYKDDLVVYFNFIMDDKANHYLRSNYTLIDLLIDLGGLIKMLAIIALLLMKPLGMVLLKI